MKGGEEERFLSVFFISCGGGGDDECDHNKNSASNINSAEHKEKKSESNTLQVSGPEERERECEEGSESK